MRVGLRRRTSARRENASSDDVRAVVAPDDLVGDPVAARPGRRASMAGSEAHDLHAASARGVSAAAALGGVLRGRTVALRARRSAAWLSERAPLHLAVVGLDERREADEPDPDERGAGRRRRSRARR